MSSPAEVAAESFIDALFAEARASFAVDTRFSTILVGGGTPSELPLASWRRLLPFLAEHRGSTTAEWTIEANPESFTRELAQLWRSHGVARVNLGVQSLEDRELRAIGRQHDPGTAQRAIALALEVGFPSVSGDVLTGIAGQTRASLEATLRKLADQGVHHVEVFGLQPEEPGAGAELSDELPGSELRQFLEATCAAVGLMGYELTAFARPGHEGQHRVDRCRGASYHALGPWAASFVDGWRRVRHGGAAGYVEHVPRGTSRFESEERLEEPDASLERLFLGLHLRSGIREAALGGAPPAARGSRPHTGLGSEPTSELRAHVNGLVQANWLERTADSDGESWIRLSEAGWLDPDSAFEQVLDFAM